MAPFLPVSQGQQPRVIWSQFPVPPEAVFVANTRTEVETLLRALPGPVRAALGTLHETGRDYNTLTELNVQIGRKPEAVYVHPVSGKKERVDVVNVLCTVDDILLFENLFREQSISSHKRVGIPETLHRLSLTTHPCKSDMVIAVTARVGRAMEGVINRMAPFLLGKDFAAAARTGPSFAPGPNNYPPPPRAPGAPAQPSPGDDLASLFNNVAIQPASSQQPRSVTPTYMPSSTPPRAPVDAVLNALDLPSCSSHSLLLIGRPGVGKTTLLRELAFKLSANKSITVVVVDKTNEIAGDGEAPHAAIGSARWMPVGKQGMQAQILREAVENQTPDVIICDEISTNEEVEAVRSIAQRGVKLIATVHGSTLPELVNDGERRNLIGGQSNVTLTDSAAQQRPDRRKNIAVRLREPAFGHAIELHERDRWVWHTSVRDSVDAFYSGEPSKVNVLEPGKIVAAFALPERDGFVYCLECGRLDKLCPAHTPKPPEATAAPATGGGGRGRGRGGGGYGVSAQFRSGQCYGCGEMGHFRFECPNRTYGV